jgi:leucyl aminopeptidase
MIKLEKKIDLKSNLCFVISKKFKLDDKLSTFIKEGIKNFIESKSEFEFIKSSNQSVFFIKENQDLEKIRVVGYQIRTNLHKNEKQIALIGEKNQVLALAEGLALSNYQFLKYFTKSDDKKFKLESIEVFSPTQNEINRLNNTLKAVYWTRDMVNEPVSYLTATKLSVEIIDLCKDLPIDIEVLEKTKIEALKMGGLLAVNKGSIEPPTFTILEYKSKKSKNKKPIVLVGKGVVYDTGGLSLKPTAGSMDLMKSDMAGAACVAGTIFSAALNKLDVHIIGLIPATDNRPGLNAYTPGDVITMYDGTTVEVLNTDAEGRMILADALAYSKKYKPELVIDAATLTGAAVVAIGTKASCLMGNADQKIMDKLVLSGQNVHERLVQLPFWDEYYEEMKSSIADLKNIGGKYAGMITAGKFLEHFVDAPYVHLDIAGPSFLESPENYKGKGGTGFGVRLLTTFLESI